MSTQLPRIRPTARPATFVVVIALTAAFSIFLVFNEDPWALGRFVVVGIAYLAAITLTIVWFAGTTGKRRSAALILMISVAVLLGGVYALSAGSGYPATNVTNSTSDSCTTFTSQTNSSGIFNSGTGFSCTEYSVPTENVPLALGYNLLAWVPLVGCVLFSMPVWNGKGASRYDSLARLIGGSVLASAILLNLVGIQSPGSLLSLPVLHVPLNPYPAYGECDSMSATVGCVYVNQLFVLGDYVFWLVVVVLATMAMSEVVSHRLSGPFSVRKPAFYSLALVFVLVVGLAAVPASIAASGIVAYPGNSYSFSPENSFVRIPFVVAGHAETLKGNYESSAPVDVYLLNSTQFVSFDRGGDYCPVASVVTLMANSTGGSVSEDVESGSYSLIFCAPFQLNQPNIQVTITNPVRLSS